ncbi:MAG: tetratricopeptide repeat protein [Hormoscilla sp.]
MNQIGTPDPRRLILTESGLERLKKAINQKLQGRKPTRENISELTEGTGAAPLDTDKLSKDTVSKILKRKKPVYRSSLERLFEAVDLERRQSDYTYWIDDTTGDRTEDRTEDRTSVDPNFVGRDEAMGDLDQRVEDGEQVILIHGEGGLGKTTLAQRYLETRGYRMLQLRMAKETQNITPVESVVEEWLRLLDEEPVREFGIAKERLRKHLQDPQGKIGVLIDNLEPALQKGKFIPAHRNYVELLTVLTDPKVKSVTIITSRERLHESTIGCVEHYQLKELRREAWHQYFTNRNINTGTGPLADDSALSQMHHAYGGNAEVMYILRGDIQRECEGDLEAYWQKYSKYLLLNPTLENLVKGQFDKLQRDDWEAYQLLCRLGCYRYQDVLVPEEGILCLLWEVPEKGLTRRVLLDLRDRGLVKRDNGKYFLHPVMLEEAKSRLKSSEDWERANRTAAEYWTESVTTVETLEHALTALEAYHHYVAIEDFDKAGTVIVKPRNIFDLSKQSLGEYMRCFFNKGGMLYKMINITKNISQKTNNYEILISIYQILGHLYLISGQIDRARELVEEISTIAKTINSQEFELEYLFRKGDIKLSLWELEDALDCLKQVYEIAHKNEEFIYYEILSAFTLAFINSYLGFETEASEFAKISESHATDTDVLETNWNKADEGYRLYSLGMTYKNIGDYEKGLEFYNQAIEYAKKINYQGIYAIACYGIAEIDREQGEFDKALDNHSESIDILKKIGATSDLAEAYYQLGLTYKKMGELPNSEENFQEAIKLFERMGAPKQVEKVKRAMRSG